MRHLLYAWWTTVRLEVFICVNIFNIHNHLEIGIIIITPFYKQGNWGPKKVK